MAYLSQDNLKRKWKQVQHAVVKDRLLFLGVVAFLGLVFFFSVTAQRMFVESLEVIEIFVNNHRVAGAALFTLLAGVSAIASLFSSIPFVPIATAIFGNIPTALMLSIGWLLGAVASYYIGSSAGYKAMGSLVSIEKVDYYHNKLSGRSSFWIVLLFRLSLPSEVTGYTLGVLRYHFGKYMLATFISEVPFAVLAVYSSEALLEGRLALFIGLIAIGTTIVVGMLYLLRRKLSDIGNGKN